MTAGGCRAGCGPRTRPHRGGCIARTGRAPGMTLSVPCVFTAFMTKAVPLPCVCSTAFMAKAVPFLCGLQVGGDVGEQDGVGGGEDGLCWVRAGAVGCRGTDGVGGGGGNRHVGAAALAADSC